MRAWALGLGVVAVSLTSQALDPSILWRPRCRRAHRQLSCLRAECSGAAKELHQKQALAADLKAQLLTTGRLSETALAVLCTDAAHSSAAGEPVTREPDGKQGGCKERMVMVQWRWHTGRLACSSGLPNVFRSVQGGGTVRFGLAATAVCWAACAGAAAWLHHKEGGRPIAACGMEGAITAAGRRERKGGRTGGAITAPTHWANLGRATLHGSAIEPHAKPAPPSETDRSPEAAKKWTKERTLRSRRPRSRRLYLQQLS